MRIKEIRLRNNYKRFHDLTIRLGDTPKKIIALVGPNGSGKSSVFDGMLFKQQQFRAIGGTGGKDSKFHSMIGEHITHDAISIRFDNNQTFEEIRPTRLDSSGNNTIFSFRNSYRYNSNLNIMRLEQVPDIKLNNYGASTTADLDDKMTQNYQRLNIYLNQYRKENDLTDKQAIDIILGELNSMLKKCLDLTVSDHGDIMAGRGTLYFKKVNQPAEFSFNVLSSGEKEVVDLLLDIYLKRSEFNDTIYIIDEPELHLNTGIQLKLLVELNKLVPENCQIWVATHSIGFLNALQNQLNDISDIIYFEGNFSQEPVILEPMAKTRDNWQKIFRTALEDLTGLLAPNTIVYCEGRHEPGLEGEDLGLDAEVYNRIFSQTHPQCLFVSSGGSTMPDKYAAIALMVLNKAFRGVQILLLKDKDINGNGSPTTNEQRQDFINKNPQMHRMLIRKEIENYLFDFEIISRAFNSITREQYNAVIPDIQADVKAVTGDLMRLCGINTGMNASGFKIRLSYSVTPDTQIYQELRSIIFP